MCFFAPFILSIFGHFVVGRQEEEPFTCLCPGALCVMINANSMKNILHRHIRNPSQWPNYFLLICVCQCSFKIIVDNVKYSQM